MNEIQASAVPVLPDKPSELLRLALHDLELCEQDARYVVAMHFWHVYDIDSYSRCAVCLAGAVMSQTLGIPVDCDAKPGYFPDQIERKLIGLDLLRKGKICDALYAMGVTRPKNMPVDVYVLPYVRKYSQPFKESMQSLISYLESFSL